MLNYLRQLRRSLRVHKPVISIEISKNAILENLRKLQNLAPNWDVAPVLKSNAYGHDQILVAEILKNENVPFFCVDSYPEAELIRKAGIKKAILIMGHTPAVTIEKNRLKNISFVIFSLEQLRNLNRGNVHLKFDTGMHRQGILFSDIDKVLPMLQNLKVEGVMSHFAESEKPDSKLTKLQIERWNKIAEYFQKNFPVKYYHCSNSGGFGFASEINANVGRSGIAIYGINPGNLSVKLQPALQMKSIVSEIREIDVGESVGYNGTFIAERISRIATIPLGFFEGLNRKLSGKGSFIINGNVAPLVGRVSMNISSCDVTNLQADLGDTVIAISNKNEDQNSIVNIAKLCETSHYEILVNIPPHLRRVLT